mmetsp:Transcript_97957/g.277655  ORF Transcript_97957/g.277655 Transcript_97957/m.277655 type:complete len:377 (+) Transcript_97957:332-1462(+)
MRDIPLRRRRVAAPPRRRAAVLAACLGDAAPRARVGHCTWQARRAEVGRVGRRHAAEMVWLVVVGNLHLRSVVVAGSFLLLRLVPPVPGVADGRGFLDMLLNPLRDVDEDVPGQPLDRRHVAPLLSAVLAGQDLYVGAIPELLGEDVPFHPAADVLRRGPEGDGVRRPRLRIPAELLHVLEVGEVVAVVEARVARGPVPLQRAVLALEVLGDLVPHHVGLGDDRGGWLFNGPMAGMRGVLARRRQVPASWVVLVLRLAVGAAVRLAVRRRLRPLQDPLVQTFLALAGVPEHRGVERPVADPELVVALMVGVDAYAELDDVARGVHLLHRRGHHEGLVAEQRDVGALHRVPAEAVRARGLPAGPVVPAPVPHQHWAT